MPEEHRYWWFQGDSVRQLKARLATSSDEAILKVTPHGNDLTLEVLEPGEAEGRAVGGPLNESHICPPVCLS